MSAFRGSYASYQARGRMAKESLEQIRRNNRNGITDAQLARLADELDRGEISPDEAERRLHRGEAA